MAKSREATKQETRAALIEAGMELFGEHGLDVSLDAICERAGFTRGAFYVHFPDRDAFLVAVMDQVGVAFLDAVMSVDRGGADLAALVQRFLTAVASGAYPLMREGGVRPHQLLDACARSPVIRDRYVALVRDSIARLAQVLHHSQAAGTVRDDVEGSQVATVALAAVIGAQTMMELGVPIDPARAGATMLTLLSSSTTAPRAARPPAPGARTRRRRDDR